MLRDMKRLAPLLLTALILSACSGDPAPKEAEGKGKVDKPKVFQVATVEELKDAAVAAGYACASWDQTDVVDLAAESGSCSDADVFATYATESDRDEQVDQERGIADLVRDVGLDVSPVLVGPNWTIKGPEVAAIAEELGATVMRP